MQKLKINISFHPFLHHYLYHDICTPTTEYKQKSDILLNNLLQLEDFRRIRRNTNALNTFVNIFYDVGFETSSNIKGLLQRMLTSESIAVLN